MRPDEPNERQETERFLCPGCAEEVYNEGDYCQRCDDRSRRQPTFDESWGDSRPWHSGPIDLLRSQI